jgi:hypothetical protein
VARPMARLACLAREIKGRNAESVEPRSWPLLNGAIDGPDRVLAHRLRLHDDTASMENPPYLLGHRAGTLPQEKVCSCKLVVILPKGGFHFDR